MNKRFASARTRPRWARKRFAKWNPDGFIFVFLSTKFCRKPSRFKREMKKTKQKAFPRSTIRILYARLSRKYTTHVYMYRQQSCVPDVCACKTQFVNTIKNGYGFLFATKRRPAGIAQLFDRFYTVLGLSPGTTTNFSDPRTSRNLRNSITVQLRSLNYSTVQARKIALRLSEFAFVNLDDRFDTRDVSGGECRGRGEDEPEERQFT